MVLERFMLAYQTCVPHQSLSPSDRQIDYIWRIHSCILLWQQDSDSSIFLVHTVYSRVEGGLFAPSILQQPFSVLLMLLLTAYAIGKSGDHMVICVCSVFLYAVLTTKVAQVLLPTIHSVPLIPYVPLALNHCTQSRLLLLKMRQNQCNLFVQFKTERLLQQRKYLPRGWLHIPCMQCTEQKAWVFEQFRTDAFLLLVYSWPTSVHIFCPPLHCLH